MVERRIWAVGALLVLGLRGADSGIAAEQDVKQAPQGRAEVVVQTGHTKRITSLAFSPDGKHALSGSSDNTAILWDMTTGLQLRTFQGHPKGIDAVAFSSNGKQILTRDNHSVFLWDAATGQLIRTFRGTVRGLSRCVELSPTGKQVMTWNDDNTADLWDVTTGEVLLTLSGHTGRIGRVAFSPDGKQVLTGSQDKTAILWDTATGKNLRTFAGHNSDVFEVAFSPNGRQVVTQSTDDRIYTSSIIWDAATGRKLRTSEGYLDSGSTFPEASSVFFSADATKVLITRFQDSTAVVWDVAKGQQLHTLEGAGKVKCGVFGPGGKQLVTGSSNKSAIVWDVTTGKKVRVLEGHSSGIASAAISPDGKRVLTGSWDKTSILWDATTAQKLMVFQGHTSSVVAVAFSPDGKQVLTGSADKTGILWDASTGQKVRTFPGHSAAVWAVAFSPDGKQVLTKAGKEIMLWQATTGEKVHSLKATETIESVIFSPDGKQLVTGLGDGKAIVWDVASGAKLRTHEGHDFGIDSIVFSPDGKELTTQSLDKKWSARLVLWDASTGQKVHVFRKGRYKAFSPDGKQLLTTRADQLSADLWDTTTGKRLHTFRDIGTEFSLTFSPDGGAVLIRTWKKVGEDRESELVLCDAMTGKKVRHFEEDPRGGVTSVAFSPDGKQVLTGSDQFRTAPPPAPLFTELILWDVASGQRLRTFQGQRKPVKLLEVSKDGSRITFASSLASLVEVDVAELKRLSATQNEKLGFMENDLAWAFSITGEKYAWGGLGGHLELVLLAFNKRLTLQHGGYITSLAFSPDGKHLLSGSWGVEDAILWDAETGKGLRTFKGHDGPVRSVAFSPDGKQVLTASDDGTAILWNTATGKTLRTISPKLGGLIFVAFSPDGNQVVTGSRDGTLVFWQAATGQKVITLQGHTDWVTCVAFDRTGTRLVSGSQDGFVRLWDLAKGRELCSFLDSKEGIVAVNQEMFYKAPKGGLQSRIAFRVGNRAFPFEQFDLRFNRPDIVLSRVGLAPKELIDAYHRAYEKRLKRMHFTEEMLGDDFHLPEIKLTAEVPLLTKKRTLTFKVRASDSKYLLDRLHVYVDGVPVHGSNGMDLRDRKTRSWDQEITVELSSGKNTIQVSVLNEKGAESLKEARQVVCEAPARKPDLYVVAVGISAYQDKHQALKYADKDATDLAEFFESTKARFAGIHVLRFLNDGATRENILKVKERLQQAKVEDQVVLFFAGHGLLDKKLDYYFCTVDIDFKEPARRGLLYDEIEGLLDGIKARKKLLLIDTCHSGELDKEDLAIVEMSGKPLGRGVRAWAVRGTLELLPKPKSSGKVSHQVLQEMFADLRKGTGAVVISAAGGLQFAQESGRWKNGVFTYAVLEGLKNKRADRNKDGRIHVSELRDYVLDEVSRLTEGRQTPTVRRDNLEFDFPLD